MTIGQEVLFFVGSSNKVTSDIENHVMSVLGCNQNQVLGAIGGLRSKGLLNIICQWKNPVTGRNEHIFRR